MAAVVAAIALCMAMALTGCASKKKEKPVQTAQLQTLLPTDVAKLGKPVEISKFNNKMVRWKGSTAGGVQPQLSDQLLSAVYTYTTETDWRKILPLLRDEQRFVAAHVVLTLAAGKSFNSTPADWNGLPIGPDQVKKNRPIVLSPEDRMALYKKWRNILDAMEIARLREGIAPSSPTVIPKTSTAKP
ncbi:MAG TPA: hypothetical protein VK970_19000 [Candidatus Methylacidiphilales bacterium]|nr:hypothetical protein [Candidatus Methylacidiphilales bacterium]